MNKLIISIILIIIVSIAVSAFLAFQKYISSDFEKGNDEGRSKITQFQSCDEICKLKNYSFGICKSKALYPNITVCGKNEIDSGQSSDCKISSKQDKQIGIRETCCCINKNKTEAKNESLSTELPFGISNPYDEDDTIAKESLPKILHDLGLSMDENGAGFVVDSIGRKDAEKERKCYDTMCVEFDFSRAKDLIDLVVGQGKTNLWVVIGSPSYYKFTDGKERKDEKTYLPDGPISRQAYKDYITALVNFVSSYGKQVSDNPNWSVVQWNLYNEVNAEYRDTFDNNLDRATTAYVNFVIDSSEILRKLSPQSKIVLAGAGSGTDLQGKHGEFYKQVFSKLKQANLDYNLFDYWESHWFGEFNNYKTNEKGYSAKDFIKFLQDNGYGDKEFLIRAGATYSGQDLQERKGLMDNYQSEQDQAEFLVKRFIYNLANGVKKIPWSTIYEREKYQGEKHVHFQYVSLIYDGTPDGVSKKQKCVKGWLPCPDPGRGVKKLSYYTFKHLIEKLKGSDFDNIQTIKDGNGDNLYLYKLNKDNKPIYIAWWDYYDEKGYKEGDTKSITIDRVNANSVKIIEAIPDADTGVDEKIFFGKYPDFFKTETKEVTNGKITITLKGIPVFVEEK